NMCPLTKIITTAEVPLRKPITIESDTPKPVVFQIVLWYLDFGCSKHMTGDRSQLTNFINKFLGTVKFKNDHVEKILGYSDYQIGNVTILRVYHVKGFGHNLFFVRQFCDLNLEVSFRQHTCFIRNLEGVDLLIGSRGNNLYTLSLGDMMASSLTCLLSKASKTKSWLWHRHLSHLNFNAINYLARQGRVQGLPKLKFEKDHLCSAYAMGRSKKKPHKPKSEDTNQETLYLLHMDRCGPISSCYCMLYLKSFHHTFSSWQTPYELLHDKLLDLSFFHVFCALCYPTNDSENLEKLQPKADMGIFIGYAPTKKAFRIYNRHTRRIIEMINVDFDELTAMASEQSSSGPALHEMTPATISSGLMPNSYPSTPFVPPLRTNWDILFQLIFDELLTSLPSLDHPTPKVTALVAEVVAPEPTASTNLPSSTTVTKMHHHLVTLKQHPKLNLISFLTMLKKTIMT
nr:integrase, catalytic region, zinc finger, CCHC-type, peptidase aspartic, catalytic [Tanacetum cinerariifolium]